MPVYGSNILPDVTGRTLGTQDLRYDAFIRNLDISGALSGSFNNLAIYALGNKAIPYSSTPLFDCAQNSGFTITLTGNAAPSFINMTSGQIVAIVITQDAVGGHAFNWPANVRGGGNVAGMLPNEVFGQLFYYNGLQLVALTPGVIS